MRINAHVCIYAGIVFASLALSAQLIAQHPRYKLVDIGTLGGPHSYGEINAASLRLPPWRPLTVAVLFNSKVGSNLGPIRCRIPW